ncbi:phosphoribosyltransferase domain-containing protein 1-like isoform X3 [Cyprinodon tularosa]|uniref:phosphoribosyltransferase domain-containing protein 1-like isoform X3 n=1 Tax=Cyprinodon tularosa TaxID=77115 RepID=UPI0018E27783|nr:phosphoribosyltransferase domain-containing protein 1-like isoform X3 [Cyprinodon tularosa]
MLFSLRRKQHFFLFTPQAAADHKVTDKEDNNPLLPQRLIFTMSSPKPMDDTKVKRGIVIDDDWPGYSLDLFTYPEHYHHDIENIYIPHGVIMNRIERLARYVMEDFEDSKIMVLCVLKGGYKFCADLVEFIKVLGRSSNRYLETRVEFIRLKSYLNDQSTEDLHIIGSSDLSFLRGKVCNCAYFTVSVPLRIKPPPEGGLVSLFGPWIHTCLKSMERNSIALE